MFHIVCSEQMQISTYLKDISSKFDIFAGYDILYIGNEEDHDDTLGRAARGLHAGGQTLC